MSLVAVNKGQGPRTMFLKANAYRKDNAVRIKMAPGKQVKYLWPIRDSGNWYDFTATIEDAPSFERRFAVRLETGRHRISDPAAGMRSETA